jgi:hypothetical protein
MRKVACLAAVTLGAMLVTSACTSESPEKNGPGPSIDNGPSEPEPDESGAGAGNGGEGEGGAVGAGGAGGAAEACPGCSSGSCLADGTCVDCLPSKDTCGDGQYCSDDNECVRGCKNGSSCASGVCEDHNCQKCISDDECTAEFVCNNGECSASCTSSQEGTSNGCDDGLTCCDLRCADLATDSQNCGACGASCKVGQFCGLTECADGDDSSTCVECHDATLANVCSVSKIVVILDTNKNDTDGNRVPGRAMGMALAEQCPSKPELIEAEQDSVEALNLTTGRPVSNSSELLVVAGGPFYQNLEGYLEETGIAPLYWKVRDEVVEFRRSKTDELVADLAIEGDHESHDIFIIQFMRDPDSGSLILNAQGFWLAGTVAAAHHLNSELLPDLSAQDKAWYAYEWTDRDGDKQPDADEIELLSSGR